MLQISTFSVDFVHHLFPKPKLSTSEHSPSMRMSAHVSVHHCARGTASLHTWHRSTFHLHCEP